LDKIPTTPILYFVRSESAFIFLELEIMPVTLNIVKMQ